MRNGGGERRPLRLISQSQISTICYRLNNFAALIWLHCEGSPERGVRALDLNAHAFVCALPVAPGAVRLEKWPDVFARLLQSKPPWRGWRWIYERKNVLRRLIGSDWLWGHSLTITVAEQPFRSSFSFGDKRAYMRTLLRDQLVIWDKLQMSDLQTGRK